MENNENYKKAITYLGGETDCFCEIRDSDTLQFQSEQGSFVLCGSVCVVFSVMHMLYNRKNWCDFAYVVPVQKSKAADMRRRSLAKQTIEDHRRRSVKALERGRVAAMTKAFGSTNPTPPPKPKPRNTSGAISR